MRSSIDNVRQYMVPAICMIILTFIAMTIPYLKGVELYGWMFKRPIYIEERAGVDLVDYSIRVVLDSSFFDFSKVVPDGSDIRFTDENGNLLPFYIVEWNYGVSATIWVKVPFIDASTTTTIYMYYGNPRASLPTYTLDDVFRYFMEVRTISVPDQTTPNQWF